MRCIEPSSANCNTDSSPQKLALDGICIIYRSVRLSDDGDEQQRRCICKWQQRILTLSVAIWQLRWTRIPLSLIVFCVCVKYTWPGNTQSLLISPMIHVEAVFYYFNCALLLNIYGNLIDFSPGTRKLYKLWKLGQRRGRMKARLLLMHGTANENCGKCQPAPIRCQPAGGMTFIKIIAKNREPYWHTVYDAFDEMMLNSHQQCHCMYKSKTKRLG